jgi:hypothetical protein
MFKKQNHFQFEIGYFENKKSNLRGKKLAKMLTLEKEFLFNAKKRVYPFEKDITHAAYSIVKSVDWIVYNPLFSNPFQM